MRVSWKRTAIWGCVSLSGALAVTCSNHLDDERGSTAESAGASARNTASPTIGGGGADQDVAAALSGAGNSATADGGVGGWSSGTADGGVAGWSAARESPFPCVDDVPMIGGVVRCIDGRLRRAEAKTCASIVPRSEPISDGAAGARSVCYDADCQGSHSFCVERWPFCEGGATEGAFGCFDEGCKKDDDCGPSRVCLCGDAFDPLLPTGVCVEASCRTDADCAPGLACVSYIGDYEKIAFRCQSPRDRCATPADCLDDTCTLGHDKPYLDCGVPSGQCGGP